MNRVLSRLHRLVGEDDLAWIERGRPPGVGPQLANHAYRPNVMSYGVAPQDEDRRLKYILYYLDVRDRTVLELGPLYGHFTVMLDKLGARRIIGIEAREENLRICEEQKARYGLRSATFLQHDIEGLYRREETPSVDLTSDVVFNAGLLYHLPDPVAALRWCREQAPEMLLMTHYYEPKAAQRYPSASFSPTTVELAGQTASALSFVEGGLVDPQSGTSRHSLWLREESLVAALLEAGYRRVDTLGRDVVGQFPHIAMLATS
jgi:SAM-dependent methyltransferase